MVDLLTAALQVWPGRRRPRVDFCPKSTSAGNLSAVNRGYYRLVQPPQPSLPAAVEHPSEEDDGQGEVEEVQPEAQHEVLQRHRPAAENLAHALEDVRHRQGRGDRLGPAGEDLERVIHGAEGGQSEARDPGDALDLAPVIDA